ncbi:MAG: SDR family NAD(P)-dependent oxidoreductase, partial [Pseudomonadota bacterium]
EINDLGGSATLVPLNLKHGDKIDILGAEIANRYGYLDILIANAGILGRLSLVSHIPPKIWQEVFDINLHANYRLIRSFDPLLRNAKDSRAIFVTSGAAQLNQPYWSAYAASKAALEAMVQTYKAEIAHSNLQVKLLDPGVVATKMREAAIPGEDQTTLTQPDEITDKFIDYVIN